MMWEGLPSPVYPQGFPLGVQYVAVRPPPGPRSAGLNPAAALRLPAVSDYGPKGKA